MSDTFRGCGLGSFITFCIAMALFIVGFGAPYWMTSARNYQGLWKFCIVDYNLCENFVGNNALGVPYPDDLRGAQTLMTLALFSGILAMLCYISWITGSHYRAPAGAVFFCLLTGGLDGGGVAIYAAYYGTPTGWAYWMSMASAPIFLATGLFTMVTVCQGEDTINRHDYTPEMMYESTAQDKKPLLQVAPHTRLSNPPMMEYPNPMFQRVPQSPVSPMEKQPPLGGIQIEEKAGFPQSYKY